MNDAEPGTTKQKAAIEPPTQPFINLSGDGPVDPTKFQCFILPQEFIEKANAVELPRVNLDDFTDSEPPRSSTPASPTAANASAENRETQPESEAQKPQTQFERPKKSEAPTRPELKTPLRSDSQDTVIIHKRRKSAPIAKEVLDGAHTPVEPRRSWRTWMLWATIGVVVLLIWFWSRGKDGSDGESIADPENSAPVPSAPSVIGEVTPPPLLPPASSGAPAVSAQAPSATEALPEVVDIDAPEKPKAKRTPQGKSALVETATKSEPPTSKSTGTAAAAPSASAAIKGVIPVIEPE